MNDNSALFDPSFLIFGAFFDPFEVPHFAAISRNETIYFQLRAWTGTVEDMKVKVDFSGGLDLLFGGKAELEVELPDDKSTIRHLVDLLASKYVTKKKELFVDRDEL